MVVVCPDCMVLLTATTLCLFSQSCLPAMQVGQAMCGGSRDSDGLYWGHGLPPVHGARFLPVRQILLVQDQSGAGPVLFPVLPAAYRLCRPAKRCAVQRCQGPLSISTISSVNIVDIADLDKASGAHSAPGMKGPVGLGVSNGLGTVRHTCLGRRQLRQAGWAPAISAWQPAASKR